MKNAIAFGSLIGLVLVSLFTFNQVVGTKLAIDQLAAVGPTTSFTAAQLAQDETVYLDMLGKALSGTTSTSTIDILNNLTSINCQLRAALAVPCPGFVSIKTVSPNGGETFVAGQNLLITWQVTGLDKIRITLRKGGVVKQDIVTSMSTSTNSYNWTIPAGIALGNDYQIRVRDAIAGGTPKYFDDSDTKFSIVAATTSQAAIAVTLVSTNADAQVGTSVNDDIGIFTIKFKITAVGDDVYLPSVVGANGVQFLVDRAGVSVTAGVNATLANLTDNTKTAAGLYKIEEGTSETFALVASAQLPVAGAAGQYRTSITGIKWGVTDNTNLPNLLNTGLEALKTSYKALN